MLKNLFRSEDADAAQTATKESPKALQRRTVEVDPEEERTSSEERQRSERSLFKKKLRDGRVDRPANPNSMFAFDNVFRGPNRILMEQSGDEGLTISCSRNAINSMVTSKWQFGDPKSSSWELGVQMHGFSDLVMASYNTMKRWQLTYQRTFSAGGLAVAQFMAQPAMMQMGGPGGSFFGLVQIPSVTGGCTALQYVKSQQFALSHMQRIVRGVHIGAQATYSIPTKDTTMAYVAHTVSPNKSFQWGAEVKPESGEWKVSCIKSDWATDLEMCAQVEHTQKRQDFVSLLSFGLKAHLVGGGTVQAAISGFSKVKAALELPFGGDRVGMNQVAFGYNCMLNLENGGLKQGVSINF